MGEKEPVPEEVIKSAEDLIKVEKIKNLDGFSAKSNSKIYQSLEEKADLSEGIADFDPEKHKDIIKIEEN